MNITKVETIGLLYPMKEPFYSSVRKTTTRSCIIVKIYTDEGIVGLGESDYAGGPISTTIKVIQDEIAPLIIGQDPFQIEKIWGNIYNAKIQHGRRGIIMHALSGVDIALWDIISKSANMPLYKLLGYYNKKIPVYASGGLYRKDDDSTGMYGLLEEVESCLERGFNSFKMKIGKLSIQADVNRVAKVRDLLGPERELMVDCNCSWDIPTALKFIPYLEDLDVKFIEEPFSVDNLADASYLATKTRIPLAGSENESNILGFKDIINENAAYYIQPNAVRVGGITAMRKIAALAEAYNRPVCPHSFSSIICILANAHFLSTLRNGLYLEYDVNENILRDLLNIYTLEIDNGYVTLSDRPGLGVELNMDVVNKYKVI